MNEPQPPPVPSPQHPAPAQTYRPLSGLAVTAFILSLVLFFVAMYGLWIVELIPLGLGILTLVTVKPGAKRGRVLAVWAIVIAIGAGSCTYLMHSSARSAVGKMSTSLLSALSAKGIEDADAEKVLAPWFHKPVLEKHPDRIKDVRARYALVEAELGAYQGEVDLGSVYRGAMTFMLPPDGVEEIGSGDDPTGLRAVVWVKAVFEKGPAIMAIVLKGGGQDDIFALGELRDSEAPIVGDLRFYRPKAKP